MLSFRNRTLLIVSFFALWLCYSCSHKIDSALLHKGGTFGDGINKEPLEVQFLGVANFIIRYKESVVITDPFVSNPSTGKVTFGKIRADSAVIAQYYAKEDLGDTKMVVVGHAHYDHVMDLPPLLDDISADATICGSKTTKHILAAVQPEQHIEVLNDRMGNYLSMGVWIYSTDRTVRVMAFESDHPPHLMGITLYAGPAKKDYEKIPLKASKWKRGQPLSFLIDFLEEDESIAYRVFSQSSSAKGYIGLYPDSLNREKRVDVTLTSSAVKESKEGYLTRINQFTRPKVAFISHWENFFRPKEHPYKTVPMTDIEGNYMELKKIFEGKCEIILPEPGSTFVIR